MASLSSYSSSGGDHSWSDTDEDVEEPSAKRMKLTSESGTSMRLCSTDIFNKFGRETILSIKCNH